MLAGARGRLEQLERRLAEEEERGIARAARRLGGRRVDEDLGVDPGLRTAIEAALGDLARAYVVERRGRRRWRESAGTSWSASGWPAAGRLPGGGTPVELRRLDDALAAVAGGRLADAVRRDPNGAVRALLARAVWAPDLASALQLQPVLPLGWLAVTRDGAAVVDALTVRIGRGDSPLERRAEADRLGRDVVALQAEADEAEREAKTATSAATAARTALEAARVAESAGGGPPPARRGRRACGGQGHGGGRAGGGVARVTGGAPGAGGGARRRRAPGARRTAQAATAARRRRVGGAGALGAWEGSVAELRTRRDRLASDAAEHERTRRDAEGRRARAEASLALAEGRIASTERDLAALAGPGAGRGRRA